MNDQGCCSSPDRLSHETWVYPSTCHGALSLLHIDVNVTALVVAIDDVGVVMTGFEVVDALTSADAQAS